MLRGEAASLREAEPSQPRDCREPTCQTITTRRRHDVTPRTSISGRYNCFSEVLRLGFVEVEDDRQVAALAKFRPQSFQYADATVSEPPEEQHALLADCVDNVADFRIVEQ
jgi:hypothetical protein